MNLSDFEVGKTYHIRTKDWDAPDGSGVIPGSRLIVTILPPADETNSSVHDGTHGQAAATETELANWQEYLRVQSVKPDGGIRLIHPETIASAYPAKRGKLPDPVTVLKELQEITGGEIRTSRRGVPHLVVAGYSACYFQRQNIIRVFSDYGGGFNSVTQTKTDFEAVQGAAEYLKAAQKCSASKNTKSAK